MTPEKALEYVRTGYKRFKSHGLGSVLYAVFVDGDQVKVMNITPRRLEVLGRDLYNPEGTARRSFVGVYNREVRDEDFYEDVEYAFHTNRIF